MENQVQLMVPISIGELIDKITILEIKSLKIKGECLDNVTRELNLLSEVLRSAKIDIAKELIQSLKHVNQLLWQIEDEIRLKEYKKDFGEEFINLARSVYRVNDKRAEIKKTINSKYSSYLVEEKFYLTQ